jgi:DNA-damage-inducible protein D
MEQNDKIVLFQEKKIRRILHKEEWYFSIIDVIDLLTESSQPSRYWNDLKKQLLKESVKNQLFEKIEKLKLPSLDGKERPTDTANRQTLLRIIQSIPSPKAEPFKQWLAELGEERLQELENPELGYERLKAIYKAKGYTEEWIKTRLKGIDIRKELTDEWKNRGVKEGQEYSILTAVIAKGTFGISPSEHKKLKGLEKPNQELRDHMTNLELVLTTLGEEVTRSLAVDGDAQGFNENHDAAVKGGQAAGESRERVEAITGKKVVSSQNFLNKISPDSDISSLDKGDKTE